MNRKRIQWLGLTGVAALLSYAAAVIFAPLAYPGYDWMAQAVSDLSAEAAPSRTLWNQLNGQRKLSLETVEAIIDNFPEISAEWLMRGTGEMKKGNDAQEKRLDNLVDVISMQQETIRNLQEKIKQLQNQ